MVHQNNMRLPELSFTRVKKSTESAELGTQEQNRSSIYKRIVFFEKAYATIRHWSLPTRNIKYTGAPFATGFFQINNAMATPVTIDHYGHGDARNDPESVIQTDMQAWLAANAGEQYYNFLLRFSL